ncbi:ABA4-like family protein [Alteraurantiacibacter buctensis]|uniref:DUF4281 domain-containing protein n=1 Tax=Alteraurantiacibacter buctensis TaxID=1503981 RepID=A0A844Z1P1_9SPHN|nr:ABA4-like family protein [Alteraurantiacibacter buctensis]MXO72604.1 DUF4281 domain-containing protein [Alteraurantiacibacter buctensis]
MWEGLFTAANLVALACWAALVLARRTPVTFSAVMYCGVALLCLTYAVMLLGLVTGLLDGNKAAGAGQAGFTSIQGVRNIFLSDGGVVVGWVHYLALDLFTGVWIARDADAKQFPKLWQAPVLIATFMAGPLGLLVWLAVREPAARRAGPARSKVLK